ncbi:hypothetical protein U9M48_027802 [Paspalum notatum var. saurae]|uniref:Uncharacterized protein n=1 Tax=Paspalum notatum var. saurae TaxID=547442 RepID=A0AAQ3TVW1_PASNO
MNGCDWNNIDEYGRYLDDCLLWTTAKSEPARPALARPRPRAGRGGREPQQSRANREQQPDRRLTPVVPCAGEAARRGGRELQQRRTPRAAPGGPQLQTRSRPALREKMAAGSENVSFMELVRYADASDRCLMAAGSEKAPSRTLVPCAGEVSCPLCRSLARPRAALGGARAQRTGARRGHGGPKPVGNGGPVCGSILAVRDS